MVLYVAFIIFLNRRVAVYRRTMVLRENLREKFYKNASDAKKICILTPRFPIPENGGDVLRINNIARQLKREGYELILVSFVDDGSPQLFEAERLYDKVYTVHRNPFNSLLQSVMHLFLGRAMQCGYYYSAKYKYMLRSVIEKEKPDLYIAHLLRMMPYLDELQLHDRSIIEMTDALSKTYSLSSKSKGNGLLRYIYAIERHLIRRAEQYSMMYFPVNVLVSEADAEYLRTISAHNASLTVHTNGVDVMQSVLPDYDSRKIVFVGNMRTLQNQDAVLFFVQEVFPRILSKIPDAKFYIVGAQAPPRILELASDNIIVTGFVDDLVSTIQDAAVAVAPVRVAAGIQNKVLVAMGCGLPVVLTSLISHAIPELEDDTNCIIRDEAATIADSCIRLMKHTQERNVIAKAGYELVCQNYTWKEKMKGYILGR
jgi:glycosyltransferase involved in cell wall biosynthesis